MPGRLKALLPVILLFGGGTIDGANPDQEGERIDVRLRAAAGPVAAPYPRAGERLRLYDVAQLLQGAPGARRARDRLRARHVAALVAAVDLHGGVDAVPVGVTTFSRSRPKQCGHSRCPVSAASSSGTTVSASQRTHCIWASCWVSRFRATPWEYPGSAG